MKLTILLISDGKIINHHIKDILSKEKAVTLTICDRIDQVNEICKKTTYDMLIVNDHCIAKLQDIKVYQKQGSCMILLMNKPVSSTNDLNDSTQVISLIKPIRKQTLTQVLQVCIMFQLQLKVKNQKIEKLTIQQEEMKIIYQAKFLLMEKEQLNEAQAHRRIEKQAMDHRCSKVVMAKRYIEKYTGKGV